MPTILQADLVKFLFQLGMFRLYLSFLLSGESVTFFQADFYGFLLSETPVSNIIYFPIETSPN